MLVTCWVEVGSRGKDGSTEHTHAWAGAGCMPHGHPTVHSKLSSANLSSPTGCFAGATVAPRAAWSQPGGSWPGDFPAPAFWICGIQGSSVLHVSPGGGSPSLLIRTACPLSPNAATPLLPDATSPCGLSDTLPSLPLLLLSLLSFRKRKPLMF